MLKRKAVFMVLAAAGVGAGVFGWLFFFRRPDTAARTRMVIDWIRSSENHPDWNAGVPGQICGNAPFRFPTSGFVGYLWDDSWNIGHRHQGIDIFGGGDVGVTPVVAVYDGYLTRLPDWKSSLIVRIPSDPLLPGREIWTYYTHMADPQGSSLIEADFPPGTREQFVRAGTLLGYQGNYSGNPDNPVGVHLHFSIVRSNSKGEFSNELDINNTLDPSPYFELPLNAYANGWTVPKCK